jgi:sugar phosphate isomerase/epimerase
MKIALQLGLIPAKTLEDKQKWALDNGVDGIEISAWDYPVAKIDQARRDFTGSPVPVSTICGNASFDFLDPDPAKRHASVDQCRQYLKLAGELNAVGQIVPPIFGGPRLPDLSPLKGAIELEKDLLVEICKELGDAAQAAGTLFLLEPLNRYEEHLLKTQAAGAAIIARCGHPAVALISDLFHMHIEETSTPQALREAGRHVRHLHLADNTRMEPGTGDIDFVAAFRALHEIGFNGYMAFECGISGNDKDAAVKKSLAYVRDCIAKARAAR